MSTHSRSSLPFIVTVILAGGYGTRFWPLSTPEMPKQFLSLTGRKSLLEMAYSRALKISDKNSILVIANSRHKRLVKKHLPSLPAASLITEPTSKNTAPATILASLIAMKKYNDPVMVIFPSDHLVRPAGPFIRSVFSAARALHVLPERLTESSGKLPPSFHRENAIYIFGVTPHFPSTSYGYIKKGQKLFTLSGQKHFMVESFHEKPDEKTAEKYLSSNRYLWNTGVFLSRSSTIIERAKKHLPDILVPLERAISVYGTGDFPEALKNAYSEIPSISFDHGILEKQGLKLMLEIKSSWSDLGGWLAIAEHMERDRHGNAINCRVHALDASSNTVFSSDRKELVAIAGLHDIIVVRAGMRTLVFHRSYYERLRQLIGEIERDS